MNDRRRPDPEQFPDAGIRDQIRRANARSDEIANAHKKVQQRMSGAGEYAEPPKSGTAVSRPEQRLQIAQIDLADRWMLPLTNRVEWPEDLAHAKVGSFLFHVPNGGGRSPIEGAIFKALGVRAGVHDLMFMLPVYRDRRCIPGLWMENKADDNNLTESQAKFGYKARRLGYETESIRTIDAFQAAVKRYLAGAVPLCEVTP